MKTAAVVIDKWKLPFFKEGLDSAGFDYEEAAGISPDTLTLQVKFNMVADLQPVVEKINNECNEQSFLCPRRSEGVIPALMGTRDKWETDRWEPRDRDGEPPAEKWPEGHPKPRTCSYCGSVHPNDLMDLLESGWELEMSTKHYKAYIHPPGYSLHMRRILKKIEEMKLDQPDPATENYVSPVPPVKLYGMHCSNQQLERLNTFMRGQKS